jgi:hypothetical protein
MMDWIRRNVGVPVLFGLILVVRVGMAPGEDKSKVEAGPNILTEEEKKTGWLHRLCRRPCRLSPAELGSA